MKKMIYTIGTSNRLPEEFVQILTYYKITRMIDTRQFPTSRFEHFKKENLRTLLTENGIDYNYLGKKLGGYRREGYPAYIETAAFCEGLKELEALAVEKLSCFMCAERFFWKCHRRFIADKLLEQGWEVYHIIARENVVKGSRD